MNTIRLTTVALGAFLAGFAPIRAQGQDQDPAAPKKSLSSASAAVEKRYDDSVAELNALRDKITPEKLKLARELSDAEREFETSTGELQDASRAKARSALDLSNMSVRIGKRKEENGYVANLLGEYIRNFESRLHIAELQRHEGVLERAKLAGENEALPEYEVFAQQLELVTASLDRLEDALGGTTFGGSAVDDNGIVTKGSFTMIGPAAIFRSETGTDVGVAEQKLGSLEPASIAFPSPDLEKAALDLVAGDGAGTFPLDPTLGDAIKIAATEDTFLEHVQKGGAVMIPIGVMAGAALLVALFKWVSLMMVRRPKRRQVAKLMEAVASRDEDAAKQAATSIRGPNGHMLTAGVEHIREPRELVEEVMYESVLKTKLHTQSWLPFVAICAAAAPLLGLLGTVTGIINTFTLITVFGSGDVKTLSGGISEALITTKFGLIVAIPSLLLHAYLTRKARGIINTMETTAVAFSNQLSKTPFVNASGPAQADSHGAPAVAHGVAPDPELVRAQVNEILGDMLSPLGLNASGEIVGKAASAKTG